jgi:hypothetical protein
MAENAKPTGIRWRWLFRRNTSLLQLWLWTEALLGKGFSPELDFHFDNYLGVFVGGRGNYYFFDDEETKEKARSVQKQIFSKPDFARRLRAKADSIYAQVAGHERSELRRAERLGNARFVQGLAARAYNRRHSDGSDLRS